MRINLDNPFFRITSTIFDVIATTLLFIVGCLPVVTIGAASTAMHATMSAIADDSCSGLLAKFFGSFKQNFKLSSLAWLILALVGAVAAADVIICFGFEMKTEGQILYIMRGLTIFCVALYTLVFVYVFAGIAKFEVTLKQAFRNAMVFITKYPLRTLGILVFNAAIVLSLYLALIWALPVAILLLYLQECILNRVFNDTLGIKRRKRKSKDGGEIYYE